MKGDGYINGGNLNFGGTIGGNSNINIQKVLVYSGAKINGNLAYSSKNKSSDLEKATIGKKQFSLAYDYKKGNRDDVEGGFWGLIIGFLLYRFLFLAIFGSIIYFSFEKLFKDVSENLEKRTGKSFVYGLIYFAVVPFCILLLLMTIIGIPFALLFLVAYIFSFVLYKLVIVTVFSSFLINRYLKDKGSFWKKLGIVILTALFITPWALVDFIIALFAFGALFQKKIEIIDKIRK
ncbi:MAG: hypothetical protein PHS92_00685 [Candidatus Gracilibacteria bacterium]|nr:hypothetical protein [Candidatus Gracilibacteria bacterium]